MLCIQHDDPSSSRCPNSQRIVVGRHYPEVAVFIRNYVYNYLLEVIHHLGLNLSF